MDESTREVLERPFPAEQIRTRKGSFGKELAYAEVHNYIARLNEAFAGDWSFDIVEHHIYDDEVVVLGRLTAGAVTKTAFGGSSITRAKDTGDRVSISDDLKSAASDSLKKCSSLLGLGLCLYGASASTPDSHTEASRSHENGREGSATTRSTSKGGNGPSRITERQLHAVLSLAESKGDGEVALRTRVLGLYGVPVEQLDRRQASEVISGLNNGGLGDGTGAGGAQ